MKNKLQLLFGDNWRSSTSGSISVILLIFSWVVDTNPAIISFLADGIEGYVVGISRIIAAMAGLYFVVVCADCGDKKEKSEPDAPLKLIRHNEPEKPEDKKV